MLKVDILFGGDVNTPNGASGLVRKLSELKESFIKYNIEQRVFANRSSIDIQNNPSATNSQSNSIIRRLYLLLSKYTILFTIVRYYRNQVGPGKRMVNRYMEMPDKGDVVVFHELWTCYSYLKKNKKKSQKVILIIHGDGLIWNGFYIDMPRLKNFIFYFYRRRVKSTILQNCDKIGFDADLPRRCFCSTYSFEEEKSFYVYNGVDLRPCPNRQTDSKLKIICVATLSERKNQYGILKAIGLLSEDYQKRIEMIFVGDGAIKNSLQSKANSLKSDVLFAGTLPERKYYDLMLKSNCFCLYSKEEGLPIAVIEGMRAALPVIGSKIAGIPEEIEDGKTGFLVDLEEKDLSEKIKWMINNLDMINDMGRASYQLYLDRFTTDAMIKKYALIYNS